MKKKISKIMMLLFIIIILATNITYVEAFSVTEITGTKVTSPEADNLGNKLITVASTIGSVVSVVVLIVIGIKYMLGSTEEKAKYKSSLLPYIIGCIFIFAASTIAGIIYRMSP